MDAEKYMLMAVELAREAAMAGETPVGCVIADRLGNIIGRGRNRTEAQDATCHAEIEAIRDASRAAGSWRLDGCSLFVTMEPCFMCAGAIINARISRLYYGVRDRHMGACGGVFNLYMEDVPHAPQVYGGILEDECATVLSDFFRDLRQMK